MFLFFYDLTIMNRFTFFSCLCSFSVIHFQKDVVKIFCPQRIPADRKYPPDCKNVRKESSMKTTITDIARDTGLSVSTISKYLNQKTVLPENARLIEESIRRLNYTPNPIAQSLRSKKNSLIALVIPPLQNCLWGFAITPIEDFLHTQGYTAVVCTHSPEESNEALSDFLFHSNIGGVLSVGGALNEEILLELKEHHFPVICIGDCPSSVSLDGISSTNYTSSYEAARYFIQHGHTRFGLVSGSRSSLSQRERCRGFLDGLAAHGLSIDPSFQFFEENSSSMDVSFLCQMLKTPEHPTALFFTDYYAFLNCLVGIIQQDLHVPEDLSVISFEKDRILDSLIPKITLIQENFSEIGEKVAGLLLRRMNNDLSGFPEKILVSTTFIEGDSVRTIE